MTVSNNSPTAGYIAWTDLHIQYEGQTYAIANGSTDKVYAWWSPAYPNNLIVSDGFPTLTANDCLVFLNKAGIALVVPGSTITDGDLIVPGTILTAHLAANCVTADQIAAGAVTAGALAAGSVTAAAIAADAIGAGHIAAGVIQSDMIVSGAITADQIAAESVTTNHITSNAITADKVNISELFANAAFINAISALGSQLDLSANSIIRLLIETNDTLKAWFTFSEDGLLIGKTGSSYRTLTDDTGFHITQSGLTIASFAKRQLKVESIQAPEGSVTMRKASDGGFVFARGS